MSEQSGTQQHNTPVCVGEGRCDQPITEGRHSQLPNENVYSIRAQILTRITRMILVVGKSALSVPDTRFSRVSGSTLVFIKI